MKRIIHALVGGFGLALALAGASFAEDPSGDWLGAITVGPGVELSEIIRAIRELPEAEHMSVVTGSLDLLVRLRVRDHAHLRELLLTKIFQISGVQRTETFLSLADVEPDNFAAAVLEQMTQRRAGLREADRGRQHPI